MLVLGKVTSLERNHVAVQTATAGSGSVAVKIEGTEEQTRIEVGKHFDTSQGVYSRVRNTMCVCVYVLTHGWLGTAALGFGCR